MVVKGGVEKLCYIIRIFLRDCVTLRAENKERLITRSFYYPGDTQKDISSYFNTLSRRGGNH